MLHAALEYSRNLVALNNATIYKCRRVGGIYAAVSC